MAKKQKITEEERLKRNREARRRWYARLKRRMEKDPELAEKVREQRRNQNKRWMEKMGKKKAREYRKNVRKRWEQNNPEEYRERCKKENERKRQRMMNDPEYAEKIRATQRESHAKWRKRIGKDGYREHNREQAQAYREANREKMREYIREYHRKWRKDKKNMRRLVENEKRYRKRLKGEDIPYLKPGPEKYRDEEKSDE